MPKGPNDNYTCATRDSATKEVGCGHWQSEGSHLAKYLLGMLSKTPLRKLCGKQYYKKWCHNQQDSNMTNELTEHCELSRNPTYHELMIQFCMLLISAKQSFFEVRQTLLLCMDNITSNFTLVASTWPVKILNSSSCNNSTKLS